MRYVAGGILLFLAALASACGGNDSSLPDSVRFAADPALGDPAIVAAGEIAAAHGLSIDTQPDGDADVTISAEAPDDGGAPLVTRYWIPVVQMPNPAEDLSMAQLGDAVAGRLADWSSITSEDTPLRVIVPTDPAPPLARWWPDATPAVESMALADIPRTLADDPGALALLPLDAVDARVRSLGVDGANIVFGTGEVASYPLAERWWVTHRHAGGEFAALLDEMTRGLMDRLGVAAPDPIVLRSTGDIIPARCAYAKQLAYGDFKHAFLELGPWLAEADLTTGSLDTAVSDVSPPIGCMETFNLASPAASVEGFTYAGIDVMAVATNHAKDCGQVGACGDDAFFASLANLRAAGIEPVGGGADLDEARRPVFVDVKGVRFAFLAYDEIAPYYHAEPGIAGTAPLEQAYVREDVAAAKAQADVVIVMPHWGVEYTADPSLNQQAIAAAASEAGATMIVGNHPHWVEANEMIGDMFVTYALGNFVFDQDWSLETEQGTVLEAAFHGGQLKGVRLYPIHIWDEHQPRFAEPDEARQILDRIWTASAALN